MFEALSKTQSTVSALLKTQLEEDSLPSTMLFTGPKYCGKMFAAYSLASETGSLKENNFSICSNRDFAPQVLFCIDNYAAHPSVMSRESLICNLRCFLAQNSAVIADDSGEKNNEAAQNLPSLLNRIREIDETQHQSYCLQLKEAFLQAAKVSQKGRSGRKTQPLNIAQARAVKAWTYLTSMGKSPKIVVIEGLEDANDAVKNSLLKLFEEPPQNCYFILLSSYPERLLPTILSRSRRYNFSGLTSDARRALFSQIGAFGSFNSVEELFESADTPASKELESLASRAFLRDFTVADIPEGTSTQQFCTLLCGCALKRIKDERKAAKAVGLINEAAARGTLYNQSPRLTIQGLLYRLESEGLLG